MKFRVFTEGGRAFTVKTKDVESAEIVAKSCLLKGEVIRGIQGSVEKEDEKAKAPKAESEGTEEGSGGTSEEEKTKETGDIPPDPGTPVNGGVDEPPKAE